MPVKVWKKGRQWCARWGQHGKVYCHEDKAAAVKKATAQGVAVRLSGWKESKK